MALLACRHRPRAASVVDLPGTGQFQTAILHVPRAKFSNPATHFLSGREKRELRRPTRDTGDAFAFLPERGAPLSAPGFSRLVERAEAGPWIMLTCCGTPAAIS